MACAPVGEKQDSSCLLNDTELSDSSNSSFSDESSDSDSSFFAMNLTRKVFRAGRRDEKKQRYLQGVSRKPYCVSKELRQSFEESYSVHEPSLSSSNMISCH